LWVDAYAGTGGDGSAGSPFQTIQDAAQMARPGDTITILPGVYRETVVPTNSGTSISPIFYRAQTPGTVRISGTEPIPDWEHLGDGLYRAQVNVDLGTGRNQVFVNDQMMLWARWPNSDKTNLLHQEWASTHLTSSIYGNGGFSVQLHDGDLPKPMSQWEGAYVHMAPGKSWIHQTGLISSSDEDGIDFFLSSLGDGPAYQPENNDPYFIVGAMAALDHHGEWFLDNEHRLSMIPPEGISMQSASVEIKVRDAGFDLRGLQHIHLEDIELFAATILTDGRSASAHLNGIKIYYPSHYDLNGKSPWAKGTFDSGLLIMGANHQVTDSTIRYSAGNGIALHGSGHRVHNSVIEQVNYFGSDAAGIYMGQVDGQGSQDIEITNNRIAHAGRSLIVHRYLRHGRITHNDLHDSMLLTTDGGATYTYGENNDGENTLIAYNRIYNNYPFGNPDENGTAVGIYLDNGSSNYWVFRNQVWNSSIAFIHNTMSNPQNHKIIHNTFIGEYLGLSSWGPNESMRNTAGTEFLNNIVVGPVRSYLTDWNAAGTNLHLSSIAELPYTGFIASESGDFRLSDSSPAVDHGRPVEPTEQITADFIGVRPDAGALEKGMATQKSGPRVPPAAPVFFSAQ
jgi:hypothetical protein